MEKVTLPRDVAEAIEAYKGDKLLSNWKGSILLVVTSKERYLKSDFDVTLKDFVNPQTMDTFLQALVIGYEVEQTSDEKTRNYIEALGHQVSCDVCGKNEYQACLKLLDILQIKIQGVND